MPPTARCRRVVAPDQAIAHSGPETEIGEDIVRDMLGGERVRYLTCSSS